MTRRSLCLVLGALVASFSFAGCSGEPEVVGDLKGEESPLPEDAAKDDSFRAPTEHGALTFGITAQGQLTDDAHYHAWDFTLTADATITLRTEPVSDNLDTVMYLYKRDVGTTAWGRYKKRSDDFEDNIWSKFTYAGAAAEYRVLIKGYKTKLRGTFALHSECAGDGCPKAGGDDVNSMPKGGDLNAGCVARLDTILHSSTMSGDGFSINYEKERGAITGIAQKGVDFYAEYWQDIGYWEDMDWNGEGHDLNVGVINTEDGGLVSVDAGGDEDTITFVFDAASELVALYHSEQSPTISFFCAEDGSTTVEEPSEFCFGAWLNYAPHNDDDTADLNGTATVKAVSDSDELNPMVAAAVMHYANDGVVAEDTEITFHGMEWTSEEWGKGALVTLSADGSPSITYETASDDYGTLWVLISTDAEGTTRFICDEN